MALQQQQMAPSSTESAELEAAVVKAMASYVQACSASVTENVSTQAICVKQDKHPE